jgi:hypothetical protein
MIISPSAISPYKIPTFQSGGAPFVGLLDLYPSAAAAYSVRLLKSDYAGSAMEVRRSSDNALQDIGFDANGDLDTASLLSFVGAGDGFVRTWYDQSGNARNKQQITASLQPKIISSGSILLSSGKPSIQYANSYFPSVTGLEGNAAISSFLVQESTDTQYFWISRFNGQHGLANQVSTNTVLSSLYGTPDYYVNGDLTVPVDRTDVNTLLSTGIPVLRGEINGQTIGWASFDLFNYFSTFRYTGFASEMIFYLSDKTADVAGINTEINSYYSIYP